MNGDENVGDRGVVANILGSQVLFHLLVVLHKANVLAQTGNVHKRQLRHLLGPELGRRKAGILVAPPRHKLARIVVIWSHHNNVVALSQRIGKVSQFLRSVGV